MLTSHEVAEDPDPATSRRTRHVEAVSVGDETVVVDVQGGCAYALDPIGSYVWDGLMHGLSVSEIVEELATAFAEPVSVIATDVSKLASTLSDLGVLTTDGQEPTPSSDPDECVADPIEAAGAPAPPAFDDRYLAAPPNI